MVILQPDRTNPYASPQSFDITPTQGRERPAGKGLAWILFSFEGRIPRRVYWAATLATTAIFYLIIFVVMGLAGPESDFVGIAMLVCVIPMFWISLAVQIKRWHDRDKSGWWVLINLVPYIGGIWAFIEVGCLRGTIGKNQFGPDPT